MPIGNGTLFPNPAPVPFQGSNVIAAETEPIPGEGDEPGTIWVQPSTGYAYILNTAGVWTQLATGSIPAFAAPTIALGTAGVAGAATTVIRSDATIAAFDATVPVTQALGDAPATGAAVVASRRDHKHGMPALSTATPLVPSGSGSAGTGILSSREDHVHPGSTAQPILLDDHFPGSALMPWWDPVSGYTAAVSGHQVVLTDHAVAGERLVTPFSEFANMRFLAQINGFQQSGQLDGLCVVNSAGTGIMVTNFHGNLYAWTVTTWSTGSTPSASGAAMGANQWVEIEKQGTVYRARIGAAGVSFSAVSWGAWLTFANTVSGPLLFGPISVSGSSGNMTVIEALILTF